ncbi:MAG: DNA replication/repair protein RecF [Alphaproteobacteria bacterium]
MTEKFTTLAVNQLYLENFRNYKNLSLYLPSKPIVITGHNGTGKTNILESISLLSPGRGFRNVKLGEIDRKLPGESPMAWKVSALANTIYGPTEIVTFNESNYTNIRGKRIVKINNQSTKNQGELAEIFSVIWLTPQMDPIFLSSRSNRRKFLDRLVYNFDIAHASRVVKYENLLRERSKLLKENKYDSVWMSTIEHNIAEVAVAIACARVQTIDYLQNAINNTVSPFPKAKIFIKGDLELQVNNSPAIQLEKEFKDKLLSLRSLDFYSNRTNAGIHLSDLLVYHSEKNLEAHLCSTGEQKAMLLTIILAEARCRIKRHSSVPVLLLDEVIAHLDENKREALFSDLLELKAQVFITGTDAEDFNFLKNKAEFIETETLKNNLNRYKS